MKSLLTVTLTALAMLLPGTATAAEGVPGSAGGPAEPDWPVLVARGDKFIYLKASEGDAVVNPNLRAQRAEAGRNGLLAGAYHFARPDTGSGAAQANLLVDAGGGWSADGASLPAALDIETNPYGASCYGLTASGMVAWVKDFSDTYHARTSRWPVIYTPKSWWTRCTGNQGAFAATNPLWATGALTDLPHDWTTYTFWQTPDRDYFNGTETELRDFATG